MNVRRSAAALAAASVIGWVAVSGAPVAHGDSPPAVAGGTRANTAEAAGKGDASPSASPALPDGLFGTADPSFDGVFRQSFALRAQHLVGEPPATQAVSWLVGQQCANGGFPAYRSDVHKACDTKASAGAPGTAPDSNSTAAAVQALSTFPPVDGTGPKIVDKALAWLKAIQNDDGGWGYYPGQPSDVNSTGLVVGALHVAGEDPAAHRSAKGGKSPLDALTALALPCAQGGAFGLRDPKTGKLTANADATAAGVLGALGKGPVVETLGRTGDETIACEDGGRPTAARAARNGAGYLRSLLAHTPYLKQSLPGAEGKPDYGNTADAVVALAAAGEDEAAGASARWLADHAAAWAKENGPAAYASLIFAARATRMDPRHFGGTDLVRALGATGPPAQGRGPDDAKPGAERAEGDGGESGVATAILLSVGVCLVSGVGIGLLLSARRTRRRP